MSLFSATLFAHKTKTKVKKVQKNFLIVAVLVATFFSLFGASNITEAANTPASPCKTGKCVLVDLSDQRIYAYENGKMVKTSLVSTGTRRHPTPVGTFSVKRKTLKQKMSGPGYYLPNVPYILWFKGSYSLHGTYWHHNFGHPMSHGCVNLPTEVAKWFYNWADVGTKITIRR